MQQAVVKQQVKENYSMSDEKLKFKDMLLNIKVIDIDIITQYQIQRIYRVYRNVKSGISIQYICYKWNY